jgi:Ribonucleases G and E
LEAADEIARQLRLRNVGGLIIGDFIDMKSRKDQQMVYNLMKERLKRDKAKTHVLPISPLGLMEMTRQRAQESLSDTIYENCPLLRRARRREDFHDYERGIAIAHSIP